MSEKTNAEACALINRLWHSWPEDAEQPVADALAAAEERGRRRGYGQCRDDVAALVDAAFQAAKWDGLYAKIQSLAPRDSAPVERLRSAIEANRGGEFTTAPRDSGKETK